MRAEECYRGREEKRFEGKRTGLGAEGAGEVRTEPCSPKSGVVTGDQSRSAFGGVKGADGTSERSEREGQEKTKKQRHRQRRVERDCGYGRCWSGRVMGCRELFTVSQKRPAAFILQAFAPACPPLGYAPLLYFSFFSFPHLLLLPSVTATGVYEP